jgi:hypothetical protein
VAIVTCTLCQQIYDDTYYLTFCPHDSFLMEAFVVRRDGQGKVCTSVAEVFAFLESRD